MGYASENIFLGGREAACACFGIEIVAYRFEFDAPPRQDGEPGYSYPKLWSLAVSSLVSHSLLPLRFVGYLGVVPRSSRQPEAAFSLLAFLSDPKTSGDIVIEPTWGGGGRGGGQRRRLGGLWGAALPSPPNKQHPSRSLTTPF